MHILLRLLTILFFLWLICNFFYSLGRKHTADQNSRKRRKVDSSVVDEDEGSEGE